VVFDVPFVAAGPTMAIPRHDPSVGASVLLVLVALAIGGLQARHSIAAVRGERPAGAVWTFLALTALVYVPVWWFTWDWSVMQWFVVASGAMVLPWRALAVAAVVGPLVGETVFVGWYAFTDPDVDPAFQVVVTFYYFTVLAMGSAVIYGSAWLGRVATDLDAARTEMAELAVGRERLRMSRDVHDLLGQTLSAVSLKGDLALRLLPTDPTAARAEIESLTDVARGALRDVRAVVRDQHVVSLPAEVEAATVLLDAAGVESRIDVDLPELAWPVEEVLAWAVREGSTNLLRHSDATTCSIVAAGEDGTVQLEIVNDGLRASEPDAASSSAPSDGSGTGLAGLAARARAASGTMSAGQTPDGRFRLLVAVPDWRPQS
jgi:two-component system sensor histidine kinase DesK